MIQQQYPGRKGKIGHAEILKRTFAAIKKVQKQNELIDAQNKEFETVGMDRAQKIYKEQKKQD